MRRQSRGAQGLRNFALTSLGVLLVVVTTACSSSKSDDANAPGGGPGENPNGSKLGDGNPAQIKPAASGVDFMSPFDATPDPTGQTVYFTALTKDGEPGVFAVAAAGGAVRRVFVGAPLATPQGIAISEDGKTLVIADSSADRDDATDGDGSLFTIGVEGGTPAVLPGSEGTRPRGLEIRGNDVLFTGTKDRKAGLYTMPLAGGAASAVVAGAPFADPSGVAIRKDGQIFVADSSPEGASGSAVIKIADGKATVFKTNIAVGTPAGIALSQDENALLVSGLDPEKGTDVVFRFDLGSGEMRAIDSVIKDFQESAGLHRAKNAEVYAWADARANKTGTVFVLSP